MSINRAIISGNLASDPELRETKNGTPVLGLYIAFSEHVKGEDGASVEKSNFIGASIFGNRATNIAPHLSKGDHVTLDGKLRYGAWEKDGVRHSKIELVVDDIDFSTVKPKS